MKIEQKTHKCCDVVHPDVVSMLEKQLSHELNNMRIYQKLSSYFNSLGLNDLAKYYRLRSHEEFMHYSSICEFLDNNIVEYSFVEVPEVKVDLEDSINPFEVTVQLEFETTRMIANIYEVAQENQDYITSQWLMKPNGLIEEQSEELRTSTKALEIAKMNLDWISKAKAILELL